MLLSIANDVAAVKSENPGESYQYMCFGLAYFKVGHETGR